MIFLTYFNIQNENDFKYYYSHIAFECEDYLRINHNEYHWNYSSFYDNSDATKKHYLITYTATDYVNHKKLFINISKKATNSKQMRLKFLIQKNYTNSSCVPLAF